MRLIDADALINRIVFHKDWPVDEKEAFEDVINEEPTAECELAKYSPKVENGSGDLIYRQAAIDAIKKSRFLVDAMGKVIKLPSAQPEIIRCKDCKHLQKWRSEESAKKFGQIYERAKNVFDCPEPEDFCSHAERRTDG